LSIRADDYARGHRGSVGFFSTVTGTIAVGTTPRRAAFTPDGTRAYVTNSGSGSVSVIDTTSSTVTGTIPVGTGPPALATA